MFWLSRTAAGFSGSSLIRDIKPDIPPQQGKLNLTAIVPLNGGVKLKSFAFWYFLDSMISSIGCKTGSIIIFL